MTSPADEPGFVHVTCASCESADVWLKCDRCQRRATFLLFEDGFACTCGATYAHALCTCGGEVPPEQLRPVAFEKGPVSFKDLEVDWRKVAVLGAATASIMGSGLWLLLG